MRWIKWDDTIHRLDQIAGFYPEPKHVVVVFVTERERPTLHYIYQGNDPKRFMHWLIGELTDTTIVIDADMYTDADEE